MSKAEARRALRERVEVESGLRQDQRSTVAWFIDNRWKPMREGRWRASTKRTNEELIGRITSRFGKTPLDAMDAVEMQQWIDDLAKKKSGSVVKHCLLFLRSIMKEAADQDFTRKNPARTVRLPIVKPVKRPFLSEKEIKALMKETKFFPREKVMLMLFIGTGLRPSELFALKWSSFDMKKQTLTLRETVYRGVVRPFTKTTAEGDAALITVLLPDIVFDALVKWYAEAERNDDKDYIFHDTEGGFLWKENFQTRELTPLGERAGIEKLNFQMLRRSVATHLQHLGTPTDIAELLRHKDPATAQANYVQAISESVRAAQNKLAKKLLG
jgi:integrase